MSTLNSNISVNKLYSVSAHSSKLWCSVPFFDYTFEVIFTSFPRFIFYSYLVVKKKIFDSYIAIFYSLAIFNNHIVSAT